LPRHVEGSFRRFLDCGIVERGFARVVCLSCRYEILVPFSCKTRGLCPSCDGRRMADGAAHLVDHVLAFGADYRQWTLSFPRWLRIRLLRDKALVSEVSSCACASCPPISAAAHWSLVNATSEAVRAAVEVGSILAVDLSTRRRGA